MGQIDFPISVPGGADSGSGSTRLASIGCTQKRSSEPVKMSAE